ncbi:hypothetical protein EW145_g623 [Phellinidium pouzarii]|uniref:Asn/Gln amidotransferase domain-containing protein n=1 Tax=Phellinidium pouzarii TaxID=167371 RepID=A0A4S4LJE0_9AGAM|nr:hypothetical protein EW145_g623 [Phellinidium pouzarii]
MRSKEDVPDYRYMPDPNLPPLIIEDKYVESIRDSMPELPEASRSRLLEKGLTPRDVDFLLSIDAGREVGFDGQLGQGFASFYEDVGNGHDPKIAFNWITHDLYSLLVARKETFKDNPVSVAQMRELIDLVESKMMTSTSGKNLLKHIVETRTNDSPAALARELSLLALDSDDDVVENFINELCLKAIEALPEEAEVVRKGNTNVLNKLLGLVMNLSRGRADAKAVHARLKNMLITGNVEK